MSKFKQFLRFNWDVFLPYIIILLLFITVPILGSSYSTQYGIYALAFYAIIGILILTLIALIRTFFVKKLKQFLIVRLLVLAPIILYLVFSGILFQIFNFLTGGTFI